MGTLASRRTAAAAVAAMLLFYMLGVVLAGAAPANAVHVAPVFIEGNQNCAAATGLTELLKIEPVGSGTSGPVTVTVSGSTFNWVSTVAIAAVFVKGGSNGNLYDYRPGSAMADTGLHAPVNPTNGQFFGLSHITFCVPDQTTTTVPPTTTTTVPPTTTTTVPPTTTTTVPPTTTTTVPPTTTTTVPPTTTTRPTGTNVFVEVEGQCSADPARAGLGDIEVVITDDGNATLTINGQQYTGDTSILGVPDSTTYDWTAVPAAGYAINGLTSGSVVIGTCDVAVQGTVVESSTTIAAVSGETLPFTGFELENTILLALSALMVGAGLLLVSWTAKDEDLVSAESPMRW